MSTWQHHNSENPSLPDSANEPSSVDSSELLRINRSLSKRIYELHNIFRISLELTSILDRKRLLFTYIVNVIGLLRANRALLLLPDTHDPHWLVPAISRGFGRRKHRDLRIDSRKLHQLVRSQPNTLWPVDSAAVRETLAPVTARLQKMEIQLIAPLTNVGRVVGLVMVGGRVGQEPYHEEDFELLSLINNFFAVVLTNVNLVEELEQLSITDGLTQLYNRRAFDQQLKKEISRGKRYGQPFSVVLLDIDHFKHYNDRHGHPAGDELLRQFATLLQRSVRETDVVARYGGEEFGIILVGVDERGGQAFCRRLQKLITGYPFRHREAQPLGFLSASFGIASFPQDATDAASLLQCADRALYTAKQMGRNTMRTYQQSRRARRHTVNSFNVQVQG